MIEKLSSHTKARSLDELVDVEHDVKSDSFFALKPTVAYVSHQKRA